MKPLPVIVALLVVIGAIGMVAWMSQPIKTDSPTNFTPKNPFESELETSGKADAEALPKAALVEELHDFGDMLLGDTGTHTFVIRNEGTGLLKLEKGPIECKCTVPTLTKTEVPPGETSEIVMTWKPESPTDEFVKSATIWTNDPEHPALPLRIRGQVRTLVTVDPPDQWIVGTIREDGLTTFEGTIGSEYEEHFEILSMEPSTPNLVVEATPMTPEELEAAGVKSGYRIKCQLDASVPVGKLNEKLTIKTDLPKESEQTIAIEGTRLGPFSLLGSGWDAKRMLLRMGDIRAAEGKEVSLSLFLPREEQPLEVVSTDVYPEFLDVQLTRDETFNAPQKERYRLTFRIPKDSPVGYFQNDEAARVTLKTNRDSLTEIHLNVEFSLN